MLYLLRTDYLRLIAENELNQVTRNDDSFRVDTEQVAYEEVKGYLTKRYDLTFEFKDAVQFVYTDTYKANQLIYLDAPAYSAASTYALNVLVLQAGNVYYCSTAIITPEAFNIGKWTLLGAQYTKFYIPSPYPRFNYNNTYALSDLTWWKDKVYKALSPTAIPSHQAQLQNNSNKILPKGNYFPDDVNFGASQWGTGVSYSFSQLWPIAVVGDFTAWSNVTAYTTGQRSTKDSIIWQAQKNNTNISPGTDITAWLPVSWIEGDNRNSKLVQILTDVSLYHLHSAIAPRNIPQLRVKRYDDAILYLENIANGKVSVSLDEIQPDQGQAFSGGGLPKRINHW